MSVTFLTAEPIDLVPLLASVQSPARGGVASFLGLVRDQHGGHRVLRLQYSAYTSMVEAECALIIAEAEARWPARVTLRHRVGMLEVGEAAIAVVAGAAHRAVAFDACRYAVEEVKRRVPIWKQEFYADGSIEWVDPTAASPAAPMESV
jgi:molybdopterin synthase catalytic subunit